jgi:hypothetical protein
MTRLLRLLAFAIAIAGTIDPAITLSGASRARVALVSLDAASRDSAAIRARIASDLSARYEVVPAITSDTAAAVVVGDRYPSEIVSRSRLGSTLAGGLLVATVSTRPASTDGERIVRIDAPREVPAATVIHIDADIESRGMTGHATDATATIGGLEVGRVSHTWTAGSDRWRASLDAVPVGDPPYVVRIQAGSVADVVVGLRREPIRVEFYDPRPSWATTFVRRALEADPRFQVASISSTSRGLSTRTGDAVAVNDPHLDTFDAVVVGGLDRLSAADARGLDRYMRERGGAVVVVPDQRIDNDPARDLISAELAERLLEQPAKLAVAPATAVPQASELLVFRALPPAADVIARVPGDAAAVIVSTPRGAGRLLISGAMDAWRYRAADNGAFDRFWQSTIAGLALSAPPPIAIDVDPPVLRPGQPGTVTARLRSREFASVSGSIDGQPVRLWPAAEPGVYRAEFVSKPAPGRSTIEVRSEGKIATSSVVVRADARPFTSASTVPLSLLAQSHRGIDVTPQQIPDLERFLRDTVSSPRLPLVRHPMRSVWWIVPFALCVSGEWWLRRRRGLR